MSQSLPIQNLPQAAAKGLPTNEGAPALGIIGSVLGLRLDHPLAGASLIGGILRLHGYATIEKSATRAFLEHPPTLEVLLIEETPDGLLKSYTSSGATRFPAQVRDVKFTEVREAKYGPPMIPCACPLDIECLLEFDPSLLEIGGTFDLTLCLSDKAETLLSNKSRLSVIPLADAPQPRGGFSFPEGQWIKCDPLLIEGWALKPGAVLDRVEIFFDGVSLGEALVGLESPHEAKALPELKEAERSRFCCSLPRNKLPASLRATFALSARCSFRGGEILVISGPQLRWEPAAPPEIAGEIEQVRLVQEGLIEVSGYLLDPGLDELSLWLEARTWRLAAPAVRFAARPDIAARYPTLERGIPLGFSFIFHPELLGKSPGSIRLAAESALCKRRFELGPQTALDAISAQAASLIQHDSSRTRVKAQVSSSLSRLGLRKKFSETPAAVCSPAAPKRYLFASHNLAATEGAPKVLFQIAEHFSRLASKPGITVVSPKDGELRKSFEALGIEVLIQPDLDVSAQTWERYHRGLKAVRELMFSREINFVFANVIDSFWAADLAWREQLQAFWLIHESKDPLRCFPSLDRRFRQLFLERLAHGAKLGFVAEETKKVFAPYLRPGSASVIPNGVDLELLAGRAASISVDEIRRNLSLYGKTVVSVVGTTTPRKGQDVFLRGMAELKRLSPNEDFRFFIVGAREGEFLDSLRALATELGLNDELRFVPETPDVAPFFLVSDVIVISSREESAPLVSLEAFAYCRALVSTTVFGLGEQIESEKNALSWELDDPRSLALAVSRILRDPGLKARLIAGGSETLAQKFNAREMLLSYQIALGLGA